MPWCREISRDPTGEKLTVIIDKMDSAKNKIPYFARNPKDIDEPLKRTLTSKVIGVIIHGRPDHQYFYSAGQHESPTLTLTSLTSLTSLPSLTVTLILILTLTTLQPGRPALEG